MSTIMNISKEDIDDSEKCRNYTVCIVECGKIGVLHACLFAEAGFKVIGVSTNPHTLELLKKGQSPFLKKTNRTLEVHLRKGTFSASPDVRKATSESDVVVIAVSTPVDGRKKPDYSLLEKACKEVGMGLRKGALVLFVSPTGPGTVGSSMGEILEKSSGLKAGVDFGLASSPLKMNSFEKHGENANSSRVIGAVNEPSLRVASLVLSRAVESNVTTVSNLRTAEAINLFKNAADETNQALANELAFLCEGLKIDFLEVLKATSRDPYFQLPPPGIINDPARRDFYLLREEAENLNLNLRLMHSARRINDQIAEYSLRLVKDALKMCGKTVRRAKVTVLGVSRSPDVKEPPGALTKRVIALLKRKVRTVQIYDPFFSKKELIELGFEAEKLSKVVEKTDCVVVLTGHSKFKRLNLKKVGLLAKKSPAIVDLSHAIDPSKAEKAGFVYRGLGRGVWTK
jgi:nucleotide sugar dehydrogenase